jgi:hypothetical protein
MISTGKAASSKALTATPEIPELPSCRSEERNPEVMRDFYAR